VCKCFSGYFGDHCEIVLVKAMFKCPQGEVRVGESFSITLSDIVRSDNASALQETGLASKTNLVSDAPGFIGTVELLDGVLVAEIMVSEPGTWTYSVSTFGKQLEGNCSMDVASNGASSQKSIIWCEPRSIIVGQPLSCTFEARDSFGNRVAGLVPETRSFSLNQTGLESIEASSVEEISDGKFSAEFTENFRAGIWQVFAALKHIPRESSYPPVPVFGLHEQMFQKRPNCQSNSQIRHQIAA